MIWIIIPRLTWELIAVLGPASATATPSRCGMGFRALSARFPCLVKEPRCNILWCNTLLVLTFTLLSDGIRTGLSLSCVVLAVYRMPNRARCWAPEEEEKPRAGQKDGCIGGSEGPALAGHQDGSRAIPPSRARLHLAKARAIIQSLIASCPSSFLTGMPSRSLSSPPTAPGLSSSFLLPSSRVNNFFWSVEFLNGTPLLKELGRKARKCAETRVEVATPKQPPAHPHHPSDLQPRLLSL